MNESRKKFASVPDNEKVAKFLDMFANVPEMNNNRSELQGVRWVNSG
jgi:hypothetical protein